MDVSTQYIYKGGQRLISGGSDHISAEEFLFNFTQQKCQLSSCILHLQKEPKRTIPAPAFNNMKLQTLRHA